MAPLRDVAATAPDSGCSDRSLTAVRRHGAAAGGGSVGKKVDPPGGTSGRVASSTGWMRRPCWTQIHEKRLWGLKWFAWKETLLKQQPSQPSKSVSAGPNAADVIAVGVELANPAATAIAVVVVARA
jgi:hypothetical protein